jgi:hypothetical protein
MLRLGLFSDTGPEKHFRESGIIWAIFGLQKQMGGKAFGFDWAWFGIVMHWVGLELLVSIGLGLALAVGVFYLIICLGGSKY